MGATEHLRREHQLLRANLRLLEVAMQMVPEAPFVLREMCGSLARMAGTRWETSIRTITSFKRKHWLSTSRGKMTILRPDQLKTLLAPSARNHFAHPGDGRARIGEG